MGIHGKQPGFGKRGRLKEPNPKGETGMGGALSVPCTLVFIS